MWRNIASNALTLFIVILVLFSGLLTMARQMYREPGPLAQSVCFKVERGATLSAVSQGLAQQGAIRDARIFRIGANYGGQADDLKFGSYLIRPGASMVDIVAVITQGGQSTCGQEVNYIIGVAASQLVLQRLDPGRTVAASIYRHLEYAAAQSDQNSGKGPIRCEVTNLVIGNNALAVDAAGIEAERRGYSHAMQGATKLEGPAEEVGVHLAEMEHVLHSLATDKTVPPRLSWYAQLLSEKYVVPA